MRTISVAFAMFATFLGILSLFSEYLWEQMKKEINQFIDYTQSSWLIWGKFNNGKLNKFSTNQSITDGLNMKRKCFIATTLILVFVLILIDFSFPIIFSVLVSVLGIVAAIFAIEAAFVEDYQEKNRKILRNFCKFLTKGIYLKSLITKKLCVIVKKLCMACDYAQRTILIDFAKEDQKLAEEIKQELKKEGIRCEFINSHEKSYLEKKWQYYQLILILCHSSCVPKPWIIARNATYIQMIARNNKVVPPAIIVCTSKDRENVNKLIKIKLAEIVYLNQSSDQEKLLNAIKVKLNNYQ